MVQEHTLHDFFHFKFVKVCFMTQNMVYLGQFFVCIWKEYILCCYWVECCVNVSWNQLVDGVLHFCILDFLSTTSVSYWERSEISTYDCGLVRFSFHFGQFLLHVFLCFFGGVYTQLGLFYILIYITSLCTLHYYVMCLFVLGNFLCSEVCVVW